MDDKTLRTHLERLRQGDRQAFSAIYSELKTPVFTVLLRMTGDRMLAEDLLQEVFLRLYRQLPSAEKPRAYVFRMARNLAIDALGQKQQHTSLEDLDLPARSCDPGLRVDLERAFARLTLPERQVVSLHLNGGLTFREVAEVTGRPLGTVLWQYHKAIGKLRNDLDGGSL